MAKIQETTLPVAEELKNWIVDYHEAKTERARKISKIPHITTRETIIFSSMVSGLDCPCTGDENGSTIQVLMLQTNHQV